MTLTEDDKIIHCDSSLMDIKTKKNKMTGNRKENNLNQKIK